MFGKKNIGIFFGAKGLSIVESVREKVKNHLFNPYPSDLASPQGPTMQRESIFDAFLDNEVEIIAFLQKSLRDSRVDVDDSDIVACIPSHDLIIRFFELPPIPKKDIEASINFEIKKYIPFRTEEITSDYQVRTRNKIIEVLFAGIKNDDLAKYGSILSKSNLKVSTLEPSQFSLLRALKIRRIIMNKGAVVIAEIESTEGTISIVDDGLLCFSRDIKIASATAQENSLEPAIFRMVNEVRVSIDYFRRQFLRKGIDRIIVLSRQEAKQLIATFSSELGTPVQYYNPDTIAGIKDPYSLDLTKALGSALRTTMPSSLIINFAKKPKAPLSISAPVMPKIEIGSLMEFFGDISKLTIINTLLSFALIVGGVFAWWNFAKIQPQKQEVSSMSAKVQSVLVGNLKQLDAEGLKTYKNNLEDRLSVCKKTFQKDFLLFEKFEVLPSLLPEGVWLDSITFSRESGIMSLPGFVYKKNEKEATDAPYAFVSQLNQSALFLSNLHSLSVKTVRSTYKNNFKIVSFEVEARFQTK